MPFSAEEKKKLLAVNGIDIGIDIGIGPTVSTRLEQLGIHSLEQLARADAREIAQGAASLPGSSCWKNRPQAHGAIEAAIQAATQAASGAT